MRLKFSIFSRVCKPTGKPTNQRTSHGDLQRPLYFWNLRIEAKRGRNTVQFKLVGFCSMVFELLDHLLQLATVTTQESTCNKRMKEQTTTATSTEIDRRWTCETPVPAAPQHRFESSNQRRWRTECSLGPFRRYSGDSLPLVTAHQKPK